MPQDDESVSASPEPAVSEDSDPDTTGEEYQMDQEQYEETKRDLSELVSTLNSIIADEDYDEWLTYLTNEYISYYSDPEVLTELSRSPLLVKYNIKLRSLRDYFTYVVVASRRDVHIDDIKALDENKVKVYMIVNNEPIVVYTLEKVDNRWKITK